MLQSITTAAADLVGTITAATQSLDAVGTTELSAAVADLERASREASARLGAAAAAVRSTLTALVADLAGIARTLTADLTGPVQQQVEAPAVETQPSPVERPAPPADQRVGSVLAATLIDGAADLSRPAAPQSEPSPELAAWLSEEVKAIAAGEGWEESEATVPLPEPLRSQVMATAANSPVELEAPKRRRKGRS